MAPAKKIAVSAAQPVILMKIDADGMLVPVPDPTPVGGTGSTAGGLTNTELRASPVPVVDSRLPAALDADGGLKVHVQNPSTGGGTTGGLTDAELRATPVAVSGPLTDTQLRAASVPIVGTVAVSNPTPGPPAVQPVNDNGGSLTIDGTVNVGNLPATQPVSGTVAVSNMVAQGLTDTQLRASAVPVAGPLTDAQLRAAAVPVSGFPAVQPVSDNGGSLTVDGTVGISGTVPVSGPLTDAQLRAAAVATVGPLTDAQLRAAAVAVSAIAMTDGTQRAINRGGAKGTTVAADVTSTPIDANTQALDVVVKAGGGAVVPTSVTARASSAATVAGQTPDITNTIGGEATILVNVSAVGGVSPTMTLILEGKDTASGVYYTILTTAAFTAVGIRALAVGQPLELANVKTTFALPRVYRFRWTVGGTTPSFTFTIGVEHS